MATLIRYVDVCRGLSVIFLDYSSYHIFVISILCRIRRSVIRQIVVDPYARIKIKWIFFFMIELSNKKITEIENSPTHICSQYDQMCKSADTTRTDVNKVQGVRSKSYLKNTKYC